MDSNTLAQGLERMPEELQILIFTKVVCDEKATVCMNIYRRENLKPAHKFSCFNTTFTAFGPSSGLGATYRQSLGNHIIKNEEVISLRVKDLKFSNLQAFLDELAKRDKLGQFQRDDSGSFDSSREIEVNHIITKDFPDTLESLIRFSKFVQRIEKKLDKPNRLCISHFVIECNDITRLEQLQNPLPGLGIGIGTRSSVLEDVCHVFCEFQKRSLDRRRVTMQAWDDYRMRVHNYVEGGVHPGQAPN